MKATLRVKAIIRVKANLMSPLLKTNLKIVALWLANTNFNINLKSTTNDVTSLTKVDEMQVHAPSSMNVDGIQVRIILLTEIKKSNDELSLTDNTNNDVSSLKAMHSNI